MLLYLKKVFNSINYYNI